jgi:hypothetical protein
MQQIMQTRHVTIGLSLLSVAVFCTACSSDRQVVAPEVAEAATQVGLIASGPAIPFSDPDFSELYVVDRAYALVGIERIRFDPTNPSILPSHREYLSQCMAILDQAIVWRVSGFQAIAAGTFVEERWAKAGEHLLESLNRLPAPSGLESYVESLNGCLLGYSSFFSKQARAEGGRTGDWQSNRDLIDSSNAIREAYGTLTKLHWRADAETLNAFYNTHMAMDPF